MSVLVRRFPTASIHVDDAPQGFIDVRVDALEFAIECPKNGGFGLSSLPEEGYGEGADEIFDDETELVERLAQLVATRSRTEPQAAGALRDLRIRRNVLQGELAARLGVKQPTVSRLEHQSNVNLDTLRKYVAALGGELQVSAKFDDATIVLTLGK